MLSLESLRLGGEGEVPPSCSPRGRPNVPMLSTHSCALICVLAPPVALRWSGLSHVQWELCQPHADHQHPNQSPLQTCAITRCRCHPRLKGQLGHTNREATLLDQPISLNPRANCSSEPRTLNFVSKCDQGWSQEMVNSWLKLKMIYQSRDFPIMRSQHN